MKLAQDIAHFNKNHFFSEKFFNHLTDELKFNLTEGFQQLKNTNTSSDWLEHQAMCLSDIDISKIVVNMRSDKEANEVLDVASMYYQKNFNKQKI
jgi:hypothetical protein